MRTQVLALGLAAFLAVSCNDQGIPTEASNPALDVPTARPQVVVNEWFEGGGFDFEGCGEWNTASSERHHIVEHVTETPSGHYKYWFHVKDQGMRIVGWDTGNEYRANGWPYTFWFKVKDLPAYHQHELSHLVAHGVNVDMNMYAKYKVQIHILESGKVVMDRFFYDIGCR